MRVRYVYSACVVIETADVKILCDPWFTPGAYDGAWYQYPPIDDPVATIGPADLVYISHIHPDHYDPRFLRRYLAAYPTAQLIIGAQQPPYLANKMHLDGFAPHVVDALAVGGTDLLIPINYTSGDPKSEIDSALAVRAAGRSVVNLNDNPFAPDQVARIREFCGDRIDFALLPYAGAGPYPQTFHFADRRLLEAAVEEKRRQFKALFARYLEALDPIKAMPFAGKYYLGGALAPLNPYRGIPDAVELIARHGDRVMVLADGGKAYYDVERSIASASRTEPYDQAAIERHLRTVGAGGFDYEREVAPYPDHPLPILPLLAAAKSRARTKVKLADPYWLVIRPEMGEKSFALNLADDRAPSAFPPDACFAHLEPRLEMTIDDRYLFGLLSRLYHWNNAEIGSHYRSLRVPETYRPAVYQFLNMLQV
ncbi:MAG: MBL fold metallo-hydrolase [Stellaceae bacterium]